MILQELNEPEQRDRTRHRSWVFTINNYREEDLASLNSLSAKYLLCGKEVAPVTGTPHLQGYVVFGSAKTRSAVARLIPRAYLSVAGGTFAQNLAYCTKSGDYFETGTRPVGSEECGRGELVRWTNAWISAKQGLIEEIPPDIRIRYYGAFKRIERDYQPAVAHLAAPCGLWIYGEAGAGKTYAVTSQYSDAYPKPLSKWWCGYQGESVVYLDDLDDDSTSWVSRFLKVWADRYSFIAESKNGSRKIRPERFVVTSQYSIEELFTNDKTRAALRRRFKVVEKFRDQNIIV